MSVDDWLIVAGVLGALSVLGLMITLCILAQGKRDDEAMHQLTDAQCGADWGQETHDHHEGCSAA